MPVAAVADLNTLITLGGIRQISSERIVLYGRG